MKFRYYIIFLVVALLWPFTSSSQSAPGTFDTAKRYMLDYVYYDKLETSYCGCKVTRRGRSGGVIDTESCGYEYKPSESVRANRLEHEHIVPISTLTIGRPCGSRNECESADPIYRTILSNMFNLTLSVGDLNGKRSNLPFGEIPHIDWRDEFGACEFKIDRQRRIAEPGDHVKGLISRTYFLMSWLYGVPLSPDEQMLFIRWSQEYPVTEWEWERNRRIASVMGYNNPFVTGELRWVDIIHEFPSALGVYGDGRELYAQGQNAITKEPKRDGSPPFVGNRNSRIYFPFGCAFYDRISPSNRVPFETEQEAINAGYRAARNC